MSFEEWANDQPLANRIAMANCCRDAFRGGAESRQAEIDELQEMYIQQGLTIAKLQKRINEAMNYVSESPLKDVSRKAMIDFLDILKGELK